MTFKIIADSKNKLRAELAARQKKKMKNDNFITMYQYEYKIYLNNMATFTSGKF